MKPNTNVRKSKINGYDLVNAWGLLGVVALLFNKKRKKKEETYNCNIIFKVPYSRMPKNLHGNNGKTLSKTNGSSHKKKHLLSFADSAADDCCLSESRAKLVPRGVVYR